MKFLWKYVNNLGFDTNIKNRFFLLITTLISGLAGLIVWGILHFFTLKTMDWMVCFVGFPAIIFGMIGGILYLYKHEF